MIEVVNDFLGRVSGAIWSPYALVPFLVIFAVAFSVATRFIR